MKNIDIILPSLALLSFCMVLGQNPVKPRVQIQQTIIVRSDTVLKFNTGKKRPVAIPEATTEYSITSYKNVDYLKSDPMQLESAGLHPDIYISNARQGVIIISSAGSNDFLKNFRNTLDQNPGYYETFSRQDTILFLPQSSAGPFFDFTKASSIRHNYKNAFNYAADPRSGVSWSKGSYQDLRGDSGYGRLLYDLIIVLPKH